MFIEDVQKYLNETLGLSADVMPLSEPRGLPFFIYELYDLHLVQLLGTEIVFVRRRNSDEFRIIQSGKHLDIISRVFNKKVVLALDNIASYHRKRLIAKRINFIVPGRQFFLPELLLDLGEITIRKGNRKKPTRLLPSAQLLLIYYILQRNNNWNPEGHPLKEIAVKLGYSAMAISNAVNNLKELGLVELKGTKEKYLHFSTVRNELWKTAINKQYFTDPVLKTVYTDTKPQNLLMLKSNISALAEYTDLGEDRRKYFALEKDIFHHSLRNGLLVNLNEYEGEYALEVWKYNPSSLTEGLLSESDAVDPLSLFLNLRASSDPRIEIALEQMVRKFLW